MMSWRRSVAGTEIKILQQGERVEPVDEVVRFVLVQPAGFRPQRLDSRERDIFVLRQDGQLAQASILVPVQVLKACLDAGADYLIPLRLVLWIKGNKAFLVQTLLEPVDRGRKWFAGADPAIDPSVGDGEHLRPEPSRSASASKRPRAAGLPSTGSPVERRLMASCGAHFVDPDRRMQGGRDLGQARGDEAHAFWPAGQKRLELCLAPDIVDHQQQARLADQLTQVLAHR